MGLVSGFTVLDPYGKGLRDRLVEVALKEHLLLVLAAGADAIRLRPNLSVTCDDVDRFCALLADVLSTLQAKAITAVSAIIDPIIPAGSAVILTARVFVAQRFTIFPRGSGSKSHTRVVG